METNKQESDSMLKHQENNKKQYFAAICASMGPFCGGTFLGWMSPVISQIKIQPNATNTTDLQLENAECGLVGASIALGCLIAALPAGVLAEKIGRRNSMLFSNLFILLNWTLTYFAKNATMLYIARISAGLGVGIISLCCPLYVGEISHPSIRGKLVSFGQVSYNAGIVTCYVLGAFLPWRILSLVLITFSVVFAGLIWLLPESPPYLTKMKKTEEAAWSLRYFRGTSVDCVNEIKNYIQTFSQSNKKVGVQGILKSKGHRKAIITSMGIMVFQQLCGINIVISYTSSIFRAADIPISPNIATILFGFFQIISAYVTSVIIEKAGRRFYLMCSSLGMFVCHASLGLYFALKSPDQSQILNAIPVLIILIFTFAYAIGYGPIPWMTISEIFAPEIKAIGGSVAVMTNFLFAAIVMFSFPVLTSSIGEHLTFGLFSIFMLVSALFVHYVVPESRGKSLDEIQEILNK